MKLSIAVPWYKSRESVQALYDRALIVFDSMSDFDQIEFVFVEDGGNDGTWEELIKLAHKDSRVKVARFSRNFGQHHALTACLDLSEGDWVVVMDCDMQDRPEEIPRLYAKTKEGFDMESFRYSGARPGDDPGETFDIREYQEGDSIRDRKSVV